MRPPACLHKLAPLLKKPLFTSREARELGIHPSVLNHYVKTGHLKRLRRGVYQDKDAENIRNFQWEDLVEEVHSVKGGVICLISALAVYDLTEQIPRSHWIGIPHTTSAPEAKQLRIIRFRNPTMGKTSIMLEGIKTPIFDRERTIIDAFRLLSRETAIKALKMAVALGGKKRIDLSKLERYARKLRFDILPYLETATT